MLADVMTALPASMAELRQVLARFASEEGVRRGLAYRPAPTDVFVTPYAKCGTTWMQQIVHGLRSGGAMDFAEITEAVPWLELAHDMGVDPAAQTLRPRAFKAHLAWDEIPKGGRYIVVFREPAEAMLSLHRFFEGWLFAPGAIPIAEFAEFYLARESGWWSHAASWWRVRGREDVLLLAYEEMQADLPAAVDRVADFMGGYDAKTRAIAAAQASLSFMKAHGRQFDDHLVRAARDAACGLPAGGWSTKVGRSGPREVPPEIRAAFEARWQETMAAEFGLASYGALRGRLAAP